jgi:hypothetical protein
MCAAEKHDAFARTSAALVRRLENNINDMRFLNNHYATRLAAEQALGREERKRVENALKQINTNSNSASSININHNHNNKVNSSSSVGALATCSSRTRPRCEAFTEIEPMDENFMKQNGIVTSKLKPETIDLMKLADARIKHLQLAANNAEQRHADAEALNQELSEQLVSRDAEISILNAIVENTSPSLTTEGLTLQLDTANRMIESLDTVRVGICVL